MRIVHYGNRVIKSIVALAVTLLLTACISQSQMYINPNRHTVCCASTGWGITGMVASGINIGNCSTDYKNLGYLPLEEAGVTDNNFLKADDLPVICLVQVLHSTPDFVSKQ